MREFGKDFTFGVATASYQIEGGVAEGGRLPSIWDTFSHTPGKIVNGDNGDIACDHFHRWEADLDLMAELGVDSYRFSLAWPRIQPTGSGPVNQQGVDFYSRLIDGLLTRGIKPLVTLYHWDLPQTLEDAGGWLNRDTAFRFAEYADIVGKAFGDRASGFATLNEPWCSAFLGYGSGDHAPGVHSKESAVRASHHLNLAHGLGVQALRTSTRAEIGIVLNPHHQYPASDSSADIRAWELCDAIGNRMYADPILLGSYNPLTKEATQGVSDWSFVEGGDLETIHQPIDFLGVNYYSSSWVKASPGARSAVWPDGVDFLPARSPKTEMDWYIYPQGLTDLLVTLHHRYPGVKLIVAENGAAMADVVTADKQVHDQGRIKYVKAHIGAVHDAIRAGAPVVGYYEWSLMDNFEWSWGYTKRFGIVWVDYETQERIWKDSAKWYQDFLATRVLDD